MANNEYNNDLSSLPDTSTTSQSQINLKTIPLVSKGGVSKSWVWKHFKMYPPEVPNYQKIGVCPLCRAKPESVQEEWEIKISQSNTSKMINHIEKYHPDIWENQKKNEFNLNDSQQCSIIEYTKKMTYHNDDRKLEFLRFVVMSDLPLSTCENLYYRRYIKTIDKNSKFEDRNSFTRRVSTQALVSFTHLYLFDCL